MMRSLLFLLLAVTSRTAGQDSCASNTDFGVTYDGLLVFSVMEANQTCSCKNYYTAGTGYFGDDINLSAESQINFANSLGQKIVLWSSSASTYYGFAMSSNTLEYRIPSATERHVFYQGTTEIMRIAGTGAVTIPGTLTVGGAATLSSTLTVSGTASVGSTSTFAGLATFNGGLRVAAGATAFQAGLTVSGATSLAAVTISGAATHSSTSSFSGLATFSGGLTVASGATTLTGTLSVAGSSTFSSTVTVNSGASVSVTGGGGVSAGAASFSTLSVSGSSSLATVSLSSSLGVSGLLTAAGGLSVTGGSLTVAGSSTISGALNVAGAATVGGLLTANSGINVRYGTVVDFGVGASRETSAGKMGYGIFSGGGGLDMVGAGTGARQINMWDNVRVQSNFQAVGTITAGALSISGTSTLSGTVNVAAAGGGIVLKAPSNGYGWGTLGRNNYEAYLVNDYTGYNSLMIIGSNPSGSTRLVQLWDQLRVNGNMYVSGAASVSGSFTSANVKSWRTVDTRGPGCPQSLGAYGTQMAMNIVLTQSSYVMISATNIRYYPGRADLCLYISGLGELNRAITYTPSWQWVSATVHWSGSLSAGTWYTYVAECSGLATTWGCGTQYGSINAISLG